MNNKRFTLFHLFLVFLVSIFIGAICHELDMRTYYSAHKQLGSTAWTCWEVDK